MRALILGQALDSTALAVALALRQRHGTATVRHVTLEQLGQARWEHRLSARCAVSTSIVLGDGDGDAAEADVVFNRIESVSALRFEGWTETDRNYGWSEWLALLLSWLESCGQRVVNRPAFASLAGPADRAWLWLARAASAGLPPHPVGATTSIRRLPPVRHVLEHPAVLPSVASTMPMIDRPMGYALFASAMVDVIVIGDAVFGEAAAAHDGCRRLARAAETAVLSIRLSQLPGDPTWRFVMANPTPVIDRGAPLAALVALLEHVAAGAR